VDATKENILVVDDNHQLGDFIAYRLLPELGYAAQVVYSGQSALETLQRFFPSLMLLDLELPDMTGLELLHRLHEAQRSVPTVLFTAHGSEHIAAEAFRLGVEDYLVKPVEPEQLEASISRALAVTRLKREAERLTAENKEQVDWMRALLKVGQSLTSTLQLDDVLRRIVEAGVSLTQAEEGFLALLDASSGEFHLRAVKNIDEARIKTTRMPVKDSLVGEAIRSGKAVRRSADSQDPSLKISTGFLVHSLLYVPIISRGKPVGVLAVDNRIGRQHFTQRDERMLTSLVDYAAIALENAALFEQARRDLAERKRVEAALRESEERYALAALGANDGIWDWDLKSHRIYFSQRWKSMLGLDDDEIDGDPQEWLGRVHPQDADGLRQALTNHLRGETPHLEHEHRVLHKNGTYRWILCRGIAVRGDDSSVTRMSGSQTDITASKEAEARLRHDAFTDDLTDLPNRALFIERLNQAMNRSNGGRGALFAVLYLDLDRFKIINDSLGHPAGDALLIAVAGMLKGQLRDSDLVARMGGDEFVILLENIRDPGYAVNIAQRIIDILSRPVFLQKYNVSVSAGASIGIVLSSLGYTQADDILRDADIAMYAAKAQGRGAYVTFDPSMHERIVRRVALELDLQTAVDKNQLLLYYQPILSLPTGRLTGFEALVHWLHPQYGLLSAGEFIPLAQEAGLIIPIDWWVFEEACRQAYRWQQEYQMGSPLRINVNLTSSLVERPDLLRRIQNILKQTGLRPHMLNLEVDEAILSASHGQVPGIIHALREIGVGVEIDNFGTGESSLLNLRRFPISGAKIARSFVQQIDATPESGLLVQTLVNLLHEVGLPATAEGVETEQQLHRLKSLGCDYGQGYLFSSSRPPAEIAEMLDRSRRGESLLHAHT
jgi:diguanylate cyclase (GGDEF)-like protein/PAS domain S-box-containing protein